MGHSGRIIFGHSWMANETRSPVSVNKACSAMWGERKCPRSEISFCVPSETNQGAKMQKALGI